MMNDKILDPGYEAIHTRTDPETGLKAFIAIHSNALGPAIGGCRFQVYKSEADAIIDAKRLAYMMTVKAAIHDLPHGGAKAVLMRPPELRDRKALFTSFAKFVDDVGGKYITSMDAGTLTSDMDIIAEHTPYVIGATGMFDSHNNPGIYTALGVLQGIKAAVMFRLEKDSIKNLHVAVRGIGHVGYELVRLLTLEGAKITVCDPRAEVVEQCVREFKVNSVDTDKIFDVPCDIFAPCALGDFVNQDTINKLETKIIAGSANNQLANNSFAALLKNKNILYAPDFVVNGGGLIDAAMIYNGATEKAITERVLNIYQTLLDIFVLAEKENQTTAAIAEASALAKLNQGSRA